jgi:hypothetical protein
LAFLFLQKEKHAREKSKQFMAIKLGSIVIEMLAETAGFISGISKAEQLSKRATREIHSSFSEMGSKISAASQDALGSLGQFGAVLGGLASAASEAFDGIGKSSNGIATSVTALAALGVAALGAAAGFIELAKGGAEIVEHLSQVSQKTGISIRDLQVLQAAGATVGVSLDDMVIGLRKFDQALTGIGKGAAGQAILRELGVRAKDNKTALFELADQFSKMEDGPRKLAATTAIFGKSAATLIPLLNKGRDGIREWEAAVDALGPKIGTAAVQANEKYRTSIEKLSLQWDAFKVGVEQDVLPTLSKLADHFNGDKVRAFLKAGPLGYADAIAKIQTANAGVTAENAKQSDQKSELLKKGEEIQASLEKTFEIQKAGGSAAYALEQARRQITDDVQAGLFKQASAIQSQLPLLEKAAALEAQRATEAQRLAASYASVLASIGKPVKPLLKTPSVDPTAGIESLFGKQPGKNILDSAPDLGQPAAISSVQALSDAFKVQLSSAQQELNSFNDDWTKKAASTAESISEIYDKQWQHFSGLFALGEITEEQFKDVSLKIEREKQEGLKQLRKDTGVSTFHDAWSDMFREVGNSGRDFARSLTSDIGDAITGLTQQLAQFIVTGKNLNFKQISQSLETNMVSSVLKKGESLLSGSLGNMFGLGSSSKPDGSSERAALFVQMVGLGGLSAAGAGALPFGASGLDNLPLLGGLFGNSSGTTTAATSTGTGGGIGGFFGMLLGLLPHFEGGGDVRPGGAYVVGEKRPELFIPRSAGTIVPTLPNSGDGAKIINLGGVHVHGVTDADSFKKSTTQISAGMGNALQRAQGRSR